MPFTAPTAEHVEQVCIALIANNRDITRNSVQISKRTNFRQSTPLQQRYNSQTKVAEWEEQDEIREVEKGWVAKANEANVECVH